MSRVRGSRELKVAKIDAKLSQGAKEEVAVQQRRRALAVLRGTTALVFAGMVALLMIDMAEGQSADELEASFLERGVRRGTFLNGLWVTYPRFGAEGGKCATSQIEKDALENIYADCGGLQWTTKWDFFTCPCIHRWHGIICDDQGHIVAMDLAQNNLKGPLSPAFGNLTWLTSLKLQSNNLYGDIPTFLSKSVALREIFLQNNKINGRVPHAVATLPFLQRIFVDNPVQENEVSLYPAYQ